MIVELGAYVILAPASPTLWHIPDASDPACLRSLCRLEGDTFTYRGSVRELRCCGVCRARGPALLVAAEEEAEDDRQPERRRGGHAKWKYGRISEIQARALHRAYTEQGLSCYQLADRVWERLGYRSMRSCADGIYRAFVTLGLERRSQSETTVARNYRHGQGVRGRDEGEYRRWFKREHGRYRPQCAAHRANAPLQQCRRKAMGGSDFCHGHDPARQAERDTILRDARTRSPICKPALREAA